MTNRQKGKQTDIDSESGRSSYSKRPEDPKEGDKQQQGGNAGGGKQYQQETPRKPEQQPEIQEKRPGRDKAQTGDQRKDVDVDGK